MGQKTGLLRVLLVDDDLAWATYICEQLKGERFDVVKCTTTSKALDILAGSSFDVLVTDLTFVPCDPMVPSGLDLVQHARHDDPSLPVVILTAHSSRSKQELLAANVPVVEKTPEAVEVLAGVIIDAARSRPPRTKREALSPASVCPDPLRLDDIRRIFAEEAKRLIEQKAATVVVPGERSIELMKPLQPYKEEIEKRLIDRPYHKNVFLMMRFRPENRRLGKFICDTLRSRGFNGVRADAPEWNITDDVYNPIAVLHCCKYGIALFDRPEPTQAFNPNVAYELGVLHQQNKNCLILKHKTLLSMPFDLIKNLYTEYEEDLTVQEMIEGWIERISTQRAGSAAQHA